MFHGVTFEGSAGGKSKVLVPIKWSNMRAGLDREVKSVATIII